MKPRLSYLSDEECSAIHDAALHILSNIGMRLPVEEARSVLVAAGAQAGPDDVVRIPGELVARAVETVPKRQDVVLYGRDAAHDVDFKSHAPALTCMTMATNVIDPHTGQHRSATNEDLKNLTRLADGLPNIRVNGGLVTPQEVPMAVNDWYTWATCLKNTTKHITGGVLGARGVQDAVKMAFLAAGGEEKFLERPFISGWVLTLPPLGIDKESLEALMELSRFNVPAIVSSGPILGTSSPITIAGTAAQAHAEILACLVVHQLTNPGAPFIYTSFARGMDMKTGNISMACPEFATLKVIMAQLGRALDLPIRMPAMLRDAKLLDAQAGFETGMVAGLTSLVADIMDGMQLDNDLLVDFADLVFCNECMDALIHLSREVVVDAESLALEVIGEVGHGGNYLAHEHTFEHFSSALWHPKLFERRNYESWQTDGESGIRDVALEKVRQLLAEDHEPLLADEIEAAIDEIVEAARVDYRDQ
jgi:trimethylamine:corrinoid methyltransferase-like protein